MFWHRTSNWISFSLSLKKIWREFLGVKTHCEKELQLFSKLIKISHTWRRVLLGFDWFAWQLHSCEDKCSSLMLVIVFGCCICEFLNCIVFLVSLLVGYCLKSVIRHCNWEKLVIQLLYCCVCIQICSSVLHLHCVYLVWWETVQGVSV